MKEDLQFLKNKSPFVFTKKGFVFVILIIAIIICFILNALLLVF